MRWGHARLSTPLGRIGTRDDLVHRIVSYPNPPEWRRKPDRPLLTWLRQMDGHCQRVGIDRILAWAVAGRDLKAYRNLGGDAAKHLP